MDDKDKIRKMFSWSTSLTGYNLTVVTQPKKKSTVAAAGKAGQPPRIPVCYATDAERSHRH